MNWLDDLEARLERELETFLAANPNQEALLRDQEERDRHQELLSQRQDMQQHAERQRRSLLKLADEIRQWQDRTAKARSAGAKELAERAERHVDSLMQQGRRRWETLHDLGRRFAAVEQELVNLSGRQPQGTVNGTDRDGLEQAWAAFEAEQELEQLRRRRG